MNEAARFLPLFLLTTAWCLASAAHAHAGTEMPGAHPALEWVRSPAAASCPDRDAFVNALSDRLGRDPFAPDGVSRMRVELDRDGETWTAVLRRIAPHARRATTTLRSDAETCDELFRATTTAMTVAMGSAPREREIQTEAARPSAPSAPQSPVASADATRSPEKDPSAPAAGSQDRRAAETRGAPLATESSAETVSPFANRLGLELAQDFYLLADLRNACSAASRRSGTVCVDGNTPYVVAPNAREGGRVAGGMTIATHRLLASYERALTRRLGLLLRAGFVFGNTASRSALTFIPIHGEADAVYHLMGSRPIDVFVFAGAGMTQVEASVRVQVLECTNCTPDSAAPRSLTVYNRSGAGFVSTGLGAHWLLIGRTSLLGRLGAIALFPEGGFVVQPSIGLATGF